MKIIQYNCIGCWLNPHSQLGINLDNKIQLHTTAYRLQCWMLLLLLSRFSHVRLCVTPQTTACLAPLSLGFSRQEYWSGLLCPSPMHTCMLSHFSRVQLCATPWTAAHHPPLSLGFSRQEYWSALPFPSLSMLDTSCQTIRFTGIHPTHQQTACLK